MPEELADNPADLLHTRGMHLRAVREGAREADFVASTDAVDSYGEIVDQSWRLERFKKNPVILFAHNSREIPIGQATKCEVVNGELECTIRFASEKANPKAEQVWQSVLEKTLRAVSVGFNPGTVRYEKRNDREVCVLSDNELFEISVTPIPANPDALAKMRARALAAQSGPKEDMDPTLEKTLRADLATKEAALVQAQKDLTAAKAETEAVRGQLTKTTEELAAVKTQRDTLSTERDAAVSKTLDMEVAALVNKKIFPSEEKDFRELAATNRPLFERMIAGRQDLKLLSTVLPDNTKASTPLSEGDADLASEANNLGTAGA